LPKKKKKADWRRPVIRPSRDSATGARKPRSVHYPIGSVE
jgi:hypothetical protein